MTDTLKFPYEIKPIESYMTPEMEQTYEAWRAGEIEVDLATRVGFGAAVLDAGIPDWATRVEIKELDLASTCKCVLGQLFDLRQADPALETGWRQYVLPNGYESVEAGALHYDDLQIKADKGWSGFDLASRMFGWSSHHDSKAVFLGFDRLALEREYAYSQLTDLWREQIAQRVGVPA